MLNTVARRSHRGVASLAIAVGALVAAVPAQASLTADGITYTLFESTVTSTEDQFTLDITGINGPSDTEGGRSGVEAIAFNPPSNFVSAALPGFTESAGGLDSTGCNGNGNFFCFDANTAPPTTPALAANSKLDFTFDVFTSASGSFAGYAPDFKINWVGTQSNPPHSGYDLVSEALTPQPGPPPTVPEPTTLALFGTALAGLGLLSRRHRRG